MKVLITGGYGYVGTALLPLLKEHELTVIDNLMSGEIPIGLPAHRFVYADIQHDNLSKIVENMDVVIHLAGIVGEPACQVDTKLAYEINVLGTGNIVRSMNAKQRLIFASSSSVYGNRPGECVTEDSTPLPTNEYSRHKVSGEVVVATIPDHVIVRPATAFGVTYRTRLDLLVNTLIYEGLTTGKIKLYEPNIIRPIIYVHDFAGILAMAAVGNIERGIYNIGDPSLTMTKAKLAHIIAQLTNAIIVPANETSLDLRDYDVIFDKLIKTGYTFTTHALEHAVAEITHILPEIQDDPDLFSTPAKVRLYNKSRGVV